MDSVWQKPGGGTRIWKKVYPSVSSLLQSNKMHELPRLQNSVSSSFGEVNAATDLNCYINDQIFRNSLKKASIQVKYMELQIKAAFIPFLAYTSCVRHSEDNHLCSTASLVRQKLLFSNPMFCTRYSVPASDSARHAEQVTFPLHILRTWSSKGEKIQTHGWLDWSSVHLERNTADAAITEGRKFKKP